MVGTPWPGMSLKKKNTSAYGTIAMYIDSILDRNYCKGAYKTKRILGLLGASEAAGQSIQSPKSMRLTLISTKLSLVEGF